MATSRAGALENVGRIVGGRYRLRAAIGSGGTAQVYLAEDTTLHRAVAVKVLHPELGADRSFIDRFRREARAAARLEHDHIVAVYDHGEDVDAGTPRAWLVMQYLAGGSLRSVLDSGQRLSPSQAAVIGIAAARGLAYAHEHGFVHRDVKPANLLFGRDGRLRIADFGLARAIDASSLTEPAGLVLGTARYASPEQVLRRPLDGRTDVYSLALVLIEAVTGKVPFAGDDLIASLQRRTEVDLEVPPELGALVPVLTEAGRLDPSRRLDAAGVARALVALRRELPAPETIRLVPPAPVDGVVDLTEALPEPMAAVAPLRRRRSWLRRLLLPLVAVVLLAGAVTAAAIVVSQQREDPIPTHVVPTLVGRTEAQATALVGGLEFEVVRSQRRQDGTVAGEVLSQDPAPGIELAEGGVLTIVVSLGPNPVAVPTVVGLAEADARAQLEAIGLEVGEVFTTPSEDVPVGVVLDVAPKDATLEPGTALDLNVSSGPAPRTVPALGGLTVDEATTALAAIQLGVEVEEVFDDAVEKGRIVTTEPGADQQVPRDSAVRLLVSKGPELVVVPSVSGLSLGGAVDAIEAAGLTAGQVYGPARGTPISTNPDAGSKVKKGTVVDIYLG